MCEIFIHPLTRIWYIRCIKPDKNGKPSKPRELKEFFEPETEIQTFHLQEPIKKKVDTYSLMYKVIQTYVFLKQPLEVLN